MMRLDKFLCENNLGSRSQVKEWIKKGLVQVNDTIVKMPEYKVCEETDRVLCQGQEVYYQRFTYYMLNKPAGVVTAHQDNLYPTVMELLKDEKCKDLSPVGRLDKDTEGLLLITNDGGLAHQLLAPKSHVPKTYYVELRDEFNEEQKKKLEEGVDIGEKKPCRPAEVDLHKNMGRKAIFLTIHEGKFHQVKRMLQVVGNEVTYLKRMKFGSLRLDETLKPGEYRLLAEREIEALHKDVITNITKDVKKNVEK